MNDAKTKLGQVKPYSYDASNFKSHLKGQLMRKYRASFGVEEDFTIQIQEKRTFFGFSRFVFAPIMAVLVLAVFFSYEYFVQPMTAYAYLKKVEKRHSDLKEGFKVSTIHTVNGYELNVDVQKDKTGDIHVSVRQDNNEVENFVMHDGKLYVRESFEFKAERAAELTSVLDSMVLAELSDPQDEWRALMERDDVSFAEEEDGLVRLTYEEDSDGEMFVNELFFRDLKPVRRVRTPKGKKVAERAIVSAYNVETIEYNDIQPITEEIEKPSDTDYVVLVDSDAFNEKITEFAETEVDDLVREYAKLPEKEAYFTWNVTPMSTIRSDVSLSLTVKEEVEGLEPPNVNIVMPKDDIVIPKESLEIVSPQIVIPHVEMQRPSMAPTNFVRDAYMEEVFYDLLEDQHEPEEVKKDELRTEKKDEKTDVVNDVIDAPKVLVPEERDLSKIELPSTQVEKKVEIDLIDHSVPEPYMAEPMDDPIHEDVIPGEEHVKVEEEVTTPSYTDLIKNRESQQQDSASRRFLQRLESETDDLQPTVRELPPLLPVNEFRKGE